MARIPAPQNGDTAIQDNSAAGSAYRVNPIQIIAVPSVDVPITVSAETTGDLNPTSMTKVKEITITYHGAYRFYFFLWMGGGAPWDQGIGQVYRNGSPVGTPHTTRGDFGTAAVPGDADPLNLIPALQADDIGGWAVGDLAQLYIRCSAGHRYVYSSNFGVWGELAIKNAPITAGVVNLA